MVEQTRDVLWSEQRPRTRAECPEMEHEHEHRRCPWASCRHHLALDTSPRDGRLTRNPKLFDRVTSELRFDVLGTRPCCSLDVAQDGEALTLDAIGDLMGVSRERIRQVQEVALERASKACAEAGIQPLELSDIEAIVEEKRRARAHDALILDVEARQAGERGAMSEAVELATRAREKLDEARSTTIASEARARRRASSEQRNSDKLSTREKRNKLRRDKRNEAQLQAMLDAREQELIVKTKTLEVARADLVEANEFKQDVEALEQATRDAWYCARELKNFQRATKNARAEGKRRDRIDARAHDCDVNTRALDSSLRALNDAVNAEQAAHSAWDDARDADARAARSTRDARDEVNRARARLNLAKKRLERAKKSRIAPSVIGKHGLSMSKVQKLERDLAAILDKLQTHRDSSTPYHPRAAWCDLSLGQRLIRCRRRLGWTQAKLSKSKRPGITTRSVIDIETDEPLSDERFARVLSSILRALDVSVEAFVSDEPIDLSRAKRLADQPRRVRRVVSHDWLLWLKPGSMTPAQAFMLRRCEVDVTRRRVDTAADVGKGSTRHFELGFEVARRTREQLLAALDLFEVGARCAAPHSTSTASRSNGG